MTSWWLSWHIDSVVFENVGGGSISYVARMPMTLLRLSRTKREMGVRNSRHSSKEAHGNTSVKVGILRAIIELCIE